MQAVITSPNRRESKEHVIGFDVRSFHPQKPTTVQHRLSGHPLLDKRSLVKLAGRLNTAPGAVRYYSGAASVQSQFTQLLDSHGTGASLEETIERLDEGGSWIAFHHVEMDPVYRELVFDCLEDVKSRTERVDPGMTHHAGWIFLSSPGAVTPFHLDYENNFLMQVRGEKSISVWDPADRTVVPEETLESFIGDYSLKNVQYREEFESKARSITMRPGDGVYIPALAPHAAVNVGDTHSITISVTYYSTASSRKHQAFRANHLLRRRGLSPAPVGKSLLGDSVKIGAILALDRAKRALAR